RYFARARPLTRRSVALREGRHVESRGREDALPALPHRRVGTLQVASVAIGVEQRMRSAVLNEPRAQLGKQRGGRREAKRDRFVFLHVMSTELRKADCMEKTRRDARGKRFAGTRDERHARP